MAVTCHLDSFDMTSQIANTLVVGVLLYLISTSQIIKLSFHQDDI